MSAGKELIFIPWLHHHLDSFHLCLYSNFGSSIMKAVYGIDVKSMNDPYIHTAEQGLTALAEAAMPGRFLVDVFPWCTP